MVGGLQRKAKISSFSCLISPVSLASLFYSSRFPTSLSPPPPPAFPFRSQFSFILFFFCGSLCIAQKYFETEMERRKKCQELKGQREKGDEYEHREMNECKQLRSVRCLWVIVKIGWVRVSSPRQWVSHAHDILHIIVITTRGPHCMALLVLMLAASATCYSSTSPPRLPL